VPWLVAADVVLCAVADVAGDWSMAVAATRPTAGAITRIARRMVRGRCEVMATVPPENVSTGN
jgi:hypothetical protein